MTYYDVFTKAPKEALARLLTDISIKTAEVFLGEVSDETKSRFYGETLEFLGQEVEP